MSNDSFVENSSDTRPYDISDKQEFQEQCIIPDQQNLAHEIQELCSGDQDDPNIGSTEVLLDNISQEFSSKEELGKPVSDKFNSEIWDENLQASHRMTEINLRKIQLLNVLAAYAATEACEKVVSRLGKYKQDLSMELLNPLVDSLTFIGKATKDKNQLRRDILKSRLPAKMKQLTKNVPAESELLFGKDLNKRISQINNTNSCLTKPAFRSNQINRRYNKKQVPNNATSNNN